MSLLSTLAAHDFGFIDAYYLFFFNETATTEIYTSVHTLSLHDALPILFGTGRRHWHRSAAARADRLDVHPVDVLLHHHHQAQEITARRRGEVVDHEVAAGDGRDLARRQVRLHDLRRRAAAFLLFHEVRERAVAQEVGRAFLDLWGLGEGALVRAVLRHEPDVVVALAVRNERYRLAVGRHRRLRVVRRLLGELHRVRAGDRLQEYLPVTGAERVIRHGLPVRRKGGVAVQPGGVGESRGVGPVRVHHVDLGLPVARRGERDARAVGRERRLGGARGVVHDLAQLRQIRALRRVELEPADPRTRDDD